MHYKNGTPAKEGDAVIYKRWNGKIAAGTLHNTSAQSDTCNGVVAIPVPGGVAQDCVNIKDLYSAEEAFAAMEAKAGEKAQSGGVVAAVLAGLVLLLSVFSAGAQTNSAPAESVTNTPPLVSGPALKAFEFFTASSSNWMVAPYAIYDSGSKSFGGGLGVGYKLSDYVVPTMRLDWVDSQLWMPSADLQLQLPVTFFGKVTAIPFAFAGIATPISGAGEGNGAAVGMFGTGLAVRLSSRIDLIGDVEKWSGAGFKDLQYRGGVVFKF
jgi:hypothetical protein